MLYFYGKSKLLVMKKNILIIVLSFVIPVFLVVSTSSSKHPAYYNLKAATPPKLLPPTNVTKNSFTANWEKVDDVNQYSVFVFETYTADKDETITVMNETFDKITQGTFDKPIVGEMQEQLDAYTYNSGWEAIHPLFAKGMLGVSVNAGLIQSGIYTPYFDLSANDGVFNLEIDAISSTVGTGLKVVKECSEAPDTERVERKHLSFATKNQKFSFDLRHENKNAPGGVSLFFFTDDTKVFLDNVKITKNLRKDDSFSYIYFGIADKTDDEIQSISIELEPRLGYKYSYAVVVFDFSQTPPYVGYENRMDVPIYIPASISTINQELPIYVKNYALHVTLENNSEIEVYSTTGSKVLSFHGIKGKNTVPFSHKGIFIIKAGNYITKIIN